MTKEVTSEDVFAESDTTRSHDPITKSDDVDTTTKTGMDLYVCEESPPKQIGVFPRCCHQKTIIEWQQVF